MILFFIVESNFKEPIVEVLSDSLITSYYHNYRFGPAAPVVTILIVRIASNLRLIKYEYGILSLVNED